MINSELGVQLWFDRAIVGNNAADSSMKFIQLVKKIPRVVLLGTAETIKIQRKLFLIVETARILIIEILY